MKEGKERGRVDGRSWLGRRGRSAEAQHELINFTAFLQREPEVSGRKISVWKLHFIQVRLFKGKEGGKQPREGEEGSSTSLQVGPDH